MTPPLLFKLADLVVEPPEHETLTELEESSEDGWTVVGVVRMWDADGLSYATILLQRPRDGEPS